MMRIPSAILAVAALVGSGLSAQAAVTVTENLTGTVSGGSTTDTLGLFGPAGANLSGKQITIHYQYVEKYFGPSTICRNRACTENFSSGSPNTPGAVLISVTVNGKQVNYISAHQGEVLFGNLSDNSFHIYADASSFGLGYTGASVYTSYSSPVTFGSTLSPTNQPVKNFNSDFVEFFTPADGFGTPSETLNFVVTSATN